MLRLGCPAEKPQYWGVWENDDLISIWPTVIVPAFGGKILHSLPHSNSGAPVFKKNINSEYVRDLVTHVVRDARKAGIIHWSIEAQADPPLENLAEECGFRIAPSTNCIFAMNTAIDIDTLWRRLAGETRTAVRKARKLSLEVREARDSSDFAKYLDVYWSTMKRLGSKPLSREFFNLLYCRLLVTGKAKLFMTCLQERVIAGLILLLHGTQAHWWTGGSLQEFWRMRPNEILVWQVIQWLHNSSISSFDLGPAPSSETSGLNLFKRHFGAERTDLVRLTLPINRIRGALVKSMVNGFRCLRAHGLVPDVVTRRLRRHLWFD